MAEILERQQGKRTLSRKFLFERKLFGQHGMSDIFTMSLHPVCIQQIRGGMSKSKLSEIHHAEGMSSILYTWD